jgi:hypothetical protein
LGRLPTSEVDAADDQWQLCAEVNRLLDGEAIPELVQDGAQNAVRLILVRKIAVVTQLL